MKRADLILAVFILLLFLPVALITPLSGFYNSFNAGHGMVMSFIKFAILATMGEMIALRIRKGVYSEPGFGLIPRAIVWGFLGLAIKGAFIVFSSGTPPLLEYLGLHGATTSMKSGLTLLKVLTAFGISATMNLVFAPVMMTFHKITDTHIQLTGGSLKGFFSGIRPGDILQHINWGVMWDFVFLKTIPIFWIPAHTVTFLLPADFQVLFAALLSIALGLILALAGSGSKSPANPEPAEIKVKS